MVPRKEMANGAIAVEVPNPPTPGFVGRIPVLLRFPALVLLSLTLSAVSYSVSSELMVGDLSSVSRSLNEWWQIGGLLGCKILELGAGWWFEYDSMRAFGSIAKIKEMLMESTGYDLAAMTLLSHLPPLYLLTAFYGIRPSTALVSLIIDMFTTCTPFWLLRPVAASHVSDAPKGTVSNRSIINDLQVQAYTTVLASGIYSVVVLSSYLTWLPVHLITHFEGIRDLSAAHDSELLALLLLLLPTGLAAKSLLFTPATGAKAEVWEIQENPFDAASATLGETIKYNLWGYSKRSRTLIKRTAILASTSFVNTFLQVAATIEGVDLVGAAGWASIWSLAAVLTGSMFWWVGHVDGVAN